MGLGPSMLQRRLGVLVQGFGILPRLLLDTSNVGRCPVKTGGS